MHKQFKNTVITGIQMFMTLQLPNRPPQDSVAATVEIWLDLLHPVRPWDDEDIANLQRAFKRVARSTDVFPAPTAIIHALEPKVNVLKALPTPQPSDADKKHIDSVIKSCLKTLQTN